jgi:hypothetical protein
MGVVKEGIDLLGEPSAESLLLMLSSFSLIVVVIDRCSGLLIFYFMVFCWWLNWSDIYLFKDYVILIASNIEFLFGVAKKNRFQLLLFVFSSSKFFTTIYFTYLRRCWLLAYH